MSHILVLLAYWTNNRHGKREDVHGRSYRSVYRKFGHAAMVREYLDTNTWSITW
jgi:hypothetical protein